MGRNPESDRERSCLKGATARDLERGSRAGRLLHRSPEVSLGRFPERPFGRRPSRPRCLGLASTSQGLRNGRRSFQTDPADYPWEGLDGRLCHQQLTSPRSPTRRTPKWDHSSGCTEPGLPQDQCPKGRGIRRWMGNGNYSSSRFTFSLMALYVSQEMRTA